MFTDIEPNRISVLYRSVSPWEMVDILETQSIRGRGGAFAGDWRNSPECNTWFGVAAEPVIHSGEDYQRYTSSLPIWEPLLDAMHRIDKVHQDIEKTIDQQRNERGPWSIGQRLIKTGQVTYALYNKLGEAYRKAFGALTVQAYASAKKLPVTSYLITISDMPGGTLYSDRDSYQEGTAEVCFPQSAGPALYRHIENVSLIKSRGQMSDKFKTVGLVFADQLDDLKVRLPSMRKATVDAALNAFERLKPKLREWIDV